MTYDETSMCMIKDIDYIEDDVVYTLYPGTNCVETIEILSYDPYEDESGVTTEYGYVLAKIYFTEEGLIYKDEFNVAWSKSATETVATLNFTENEMSSYDPPITIAEFGTTVPTLFTTYAYLEEENLIINATQDRTKLHVTATNLEGLLMQEIVVSSYAEDYITACPEDIGEEDNEDLSEIGSDTHLFSAGDYPVKTYSEKYYYESGNLASELLVNFELNTDCNISDEMKMIDLTFYEYYENG